MSARMRVLLVFSVITGFSGCSGSTPEAGIGVWQKVGPGAMLVKSVEIGKVQGKGMFGKGSSPDEHLLVRVQFRNESDSVALKLSALVNDSSVMLVGVSLTDPQKKAWPTVHFGLLATIDGRLPRDTILEPGAAPVEDLLTFEKAAGDAESLLLEIPPHWLEKDGEFWRVPSRKEKFRFRILKEAWSR
jgi:hypothetical protein